MTENVLDIKTISTKQAEFQADRFWVSQQLTNESEKADSSHFLKFLLASRTTGTLGFAQQ